jgi:hypothetical protein
MNKMGMTKLTGSEVLFLSFAAKFLACTKSAQPSELPDTFVVRPKTYPQDDGPQYKPIVLPCRGLGRTGVSLRHV